MEGKRDTIVASSTLRLCTKANTGSQLKDWTTCLPVRGVYRMAKSELFADISLSCVD